MLSIANAPPSTRYLMVASKISDNRWNNECDEVRTFLTSDPSNIEASAVEQMLRIINSPLPNNSVPLVVIHCYADVPAGTRYDLAFDSTDPDCTVSTCCTLEFGVVMSRIVETSLSHGWHQTAVLRFPNGLPK